MAERLNTIVCAFDATSPRITAYDIHEWMQQSLQIPEQTVSTIQIDGIKRQVYIKLIDNAKLQALLRETSGQAEYKHHNGVLSIVNIAVAGKGTKRFRIANLPPEVKEYAIRTALTPFGTVLAVIEEMWPNTYIYKVPNGVRQVTITLTKPIPSQLIVDGHRTLLSYEGQPTTCYGCGDIGHLYPTCPKRRNRATVPRDQQHETYATVVAPSTSTPPKITENATDVILSNNAEKPVDHTTPNMDVPRHEGGTYIEDTEPPPTVEPESHRIHRNIHSETAHQNKSNKIKWRKTPML